MSARDLARVEVRRPPAGRSARRRGRAGGPCGRGSSRRRRRGTRTAPRSRPSCARTARTTASTSRVSVTLEALLDGRDLGDAAERGAPRCTAAPRNVSHDLLRAAPCPRSARRASGRWRRCARARSSRPPRPRRARRARPAPCWPPWPSRCRRRPPGCRAARLARADRPRDRERDVRVVDGLGARRCRGRGRRTPRRSRRLLDLLLEREAAVVGAEGDHRDGWPLRGLDDAHAARRPRSRAPRASRSRRPTRGSRLPPAPRSTSSAVTTSFMDRPR